MSLNFPNDPQPNDIYTVGATTWQWNGTAWNLDFGSIPQQLTNFSTITVNGQDDIVADQINDVINVVAGTNVSLATNAVAKSITINSIASEGGASNSFVNVAVAGQNTVIADSTTDTLTLAAGTGISITTDDSTDTVTISSTAGAGSTFFNTLTDSALASLTIDKVYLPAITSLDVTNSGASAYLFDQYSGSNPTIFSISGTTIAFRLSASGHPFLIQDGAGNNYNTGLFHVSTTGVVSTGASAQGKDSGTLYWKLPAGISGGYRYQCSLHASMVGSITVKSFATL